MPVLDLALRGPVELTIAPYTARLFAEKLREESQGGEKQNVDLAAALTDLESYAAESIGSTDQAEEAEELVNVKSTQNLSLEPEQAVIGCEWLPHIWYAPLGKEICRNCFRTRACHPKSD